MRWFSKNPGRVFFSATLIAGLSTLSCQTAPLSHAECAESLASWEATIGEQSLALREGQANRAPASSDPATTGIGGFANQLSSAPAALDRWMKSVDGNRARETDETQDLWMARAERGLKTAQNWIERLDSEPARRGAREEMNLIANRWVVLHGFAFMKKPRDMRRVLEEIRTRVHAVRAPACQ